MSEAGQSVVGFSNKTKAALYQLKSALQQDTVAANAFAVNAGAVLSGITQKAVATKTALAGLATVESLSGLTNNIGLLRGNLDALYKTSKRASVLASIFKPLDSAILGSLVVASVLPEKLVGYTRKAITGVSSAAQSGKRLFRKGLFLFLTGDAVSAIGEIKRVGSAIKSGIGNAVSSTYAKVKSLKFSDINNAWKASVNGVARAYGALRARLKDVAVAAESAASKARQGLSSVASSVGAIGAAMGAVAAYKFVNFSIGAGKLAAEAEQTEIAFSVLFGSVEKGNKALADLKHFADVTPFKTEEVIQAGKSLKAFGFDAAAIVPTMTRLGDVAAGLNIPIGELSELYGKARTQGTLFSEDINQLTGRGIPIISELAKVMGVAESEVKKLASQGKITFPLLEKAFKNMTATGSQFGGLMAKQSDSVSGKFSNLQAVIERITTKIGKSILSAFDVKGSLQSITDFVTGLEKYLPVVEGFYTSIKIAALDFVGAFSGAFAGVGVSTETFINLFKRLSFSIRSSVKGIQLSALYLELGFVKAFNSLSYYLTEFLPAGFSYLYNNARDIFADIFNFVTSVVSNLGKNITALITNLPALLSGKLDLASVLVPLDAGFQKIRADFVAPIKKQSELEATLGEMIDETKQKIQKDFEDVFNVLPDAMDKVKEPLADKLKDIFSGIGGAIGDKIKSKVSDAAQTALSVINGAKTVFGGEQKEKPANAAYGSALFGSTDAIRKVNASGVDTKKEDKQEKVKKTIEAGNKLLGKAVGFLGTLVNKPQAVVEL